MSTYPQLYYDEIRGRLTAVFIGVADLLPASTREFVQEELDANELGVALQAMVEVLTEVGEPVPSDAAAEMAALAGRMEMDLDVSAVPVTS